MGFYTQRFQNKRFLITCHHRSRRFCQKPTSEKTRMHSTPARRLHPRRHGKPSTLATQSSSSRSSRKLRGTTPLIAPSPARRRRVSGARRTVFHDASSSLARVVFVVTKRRHRACDESSRRRTTRATARSTDDERSREVSLPPRRSISSILAFSGARVSRRVSSFQSRFRANQRDRATLFRRVPRARAGRPGPGTRAAAASRRCGVLARARAPVGPGSPRARPCSPRSRLDRRVESRIAQSEKGGNIRGILGAAGANRPARRGVFVCFCFFSVFFSGERDRRADSADSEPRD
jgi:hypothetical protein